MAKGVIVLCEVGVLLLESDNEFNNYNHVWNKKFGFYNENDILYKEKDMEEAIQYAKDYVEQGVNMTYAIIGNEGVCVWDEPFDDGDLDVIAGKYDMEDVLYSVAKIDGKVVENFLGKME